MEDVLSPPREKVRILSPTGFRGTIGEPDRLWLASTLFALILPVAMALKEWESRWPNREFWSLLPVRIEKGLQMPLGTLWSKKEV